jgi:hypothetical protein
VIVQGVGGVVTVLKGSYAPMQKEAMLACRSSYLVTSCLTGGNVEHRSCRVFCWQLMALVLADDTAAAAATAEAVPYPA